MLSHKSESTNLQDYFNKMRFFQKLIRNLHVAADVPLKNEKKNTLNAALFCILNGRYSSLLVIISMSVAAEPIHLDF